MEIAIVGAGMAGLSCADDLVRAGHNVALYDKGRGAGGRMSTRRLATGLGDVSFDHGAQYFTARDPGFCSQVDAWHALGVVERWPLVADDAWVGSPGMNAVIKHMASTSAVTWATRVTGLVRRDERWWLMAEAGEIGPFEAVVLAIPAEQAAPMLSLHDFAMARIALMARSRPCWTGMFVFDSVLADLPAVIRTGSDISWAARNSAKPGRSGPEAWVLQASASWSEARTELAKEVILKDLLAILSATTGSITPEPIAASAHLWRYALSPGTGDGALWNIDSGLGVCGDWLLGPRVECAWLSGKMLAQSIAR